MRNACTLHEHCFHAVYVIFGATGGVGSDLAKRLLAANNKVVMAADNEDKLSKLKEELGGGETKTIDVMNSQQVSAYCEWHASPPGFCSSDMQSSGSS